MLFPLLSAFSSLLLACFHLVAHLVGGAGATKTALSGLLHDRSEKKDISARFLCGVH